MRPTNRLLSLAGLSAAALLLAAACSSAAATPAATVLGATDVPSTVPVASQAAGTFTIGVANDPTLGAYLTGKDGMTLYIFKADAPGVSNCSGSCATNWPPLTVAEGMTVTPPAGATGSFAPIIRADGTRQAAHDNQPLYYYAGDSKAGDTTGQGLNGKWFVAPLTSDAGGAVSAAPTIGY
jgi:predicted lipoprotein with Yx(FWY)xxD motif